MNDFALLLRKDYFVLLNNIKLILRNPFRLLPYAGLVAYFSFFYFRGRSKRLEGGMADLEQVEDAVGMDYSVQNIIGIFTVLGLILLIFQLYKATQKNVSFFTMADVNFLFPSPISPSRILLYYMLRSLIPALGIGIIFVAYGGSQLSEAFDLQFVDFLLLGLGGALFFFMLSPIRFLIYVLNTKYDVLQTVRNGLWAIAVALVLMMVIPGIMAEKFWQGMFAWISSRWFDLFPMVGWSRGIITYMGHGNLWVSSGFVLLYGVAFFVVARLVLVHSGHYYEDVLETTQSKEEQKEKVKGKKEASESSLSLNTSKKLALPNFGFGATALYWRNYVHSSRQDFHPLIGVYGLGMAGIAIGLAVLAYFDVASHMLVYGYFLFTIMLYFFAGMGRAQVGDLKKPFFILIPATWSAKFWNLIRLDVYQLLITSLVMVVPSVWIAALDWKLMFLVPFCVLAFYLTGLAITLTTTVGFEEGWDQKLIKPLIIGGVIIFGILPSLGLGVFTFIVSNQFAFGMLAIALGMAVVAAVMLHLALDLIRRIEFKEV